SQLASLSSSVFANLFFGHYLERTQSILRLPLVDNVSSLYESIYIPLLITQNCRSLRRSPSNIAIHDWLDGYFDTKQMEDGLINLLQC
ncbi:hypothetical protein PFISCL1PPCAC_4004, partial [Pristionchus fissidentatus]